MKMKVKNLSIMVIIMTLTVFSVGSSTAEEKALKLVPDNAALIYWQAFAMLPTLNEKEQDALKNRAKATAEEKKLLMQIESRTKLTLDLIAKRSMIKDCDWGIIYDDGFSALLPHLSKLRQTARIMMLRADHSKDSKRKADALISVIQMSKHANEGPIICTLVSWSIMEIVLNDMDKNGQRLDKIERDRVLDAISSFNLKAGFKKGLNIESKMAITALKKYLKNPEAIKPAMDNKNMTETQLRDMLEDAIPEYSAVFEKMQASLDLGHDEAMKRCQEMDKAAKQSDNELIRQLQPSFTAFLKRYLKMHKRLHNDTL